ncbi:helix-turn-helix domain-containing protein [Planktothrix mougeotii]|uniref:Helix-turn-helix transcriptional regulator n=1 Tax=Planktothrix mougeotii LEGE 06226 TaxID=1828728 RepID=A0ABR9U723_9CYAN|nr:helix-turn-helix domain-containing protein [Planktothrix mougeotii]MBE9142260.1 helix-turn-helix transcriptional regulator [Planktothrix mougeotii LEGE 06226]
MTETNTQDVLAFLDKIIPDTPEMQLIERQELFRLTLTQVMGNLRKNLGLTQAELAEKMGVTQSWISKLESANNDHAFESVLAYLDALGADFEVTILLKGKKVAVIPALLRMTPEEFEASLSTVLDISEELENNYQDITAFKQDKLSVG